MILQIALSPIPESLVIPMASVRRCAERLGHEYQLNEQPTSWPCIQAESNRLRIEWAAENPYSLYADWDVFINDDFQMPTGDRMTVDRWNHEAFFYTGDGQLCKQILSDLNAYPHDQEIYQPARLGKIVNRYRDRFGFFEPDGYRHLCHTSKPRSS